MKRPEPRSRGTVALRLAIAVVGVALVVAVLFLANRNANGIFRAQKAPVVASTAHTSVPASTSTTVPTATVAATCRAAGDLAITIDQAENNTDAMYDALLPVPQSQDWQLLTALHASGIDGVGQLAAEVQTFASSFTGWLAAPTSSTEPLSTGALLQDCRNIGYSEP